jgi:hypothetical protein
MQNNDLGLLILHHTQKINLKWIEDPNIRPGTIKLKKEIIGEKALDIGLGNEFLAIIPKAQAKKAKINKWDDIKPKKLLQSKQLKEKGNLQIWRKYFQTVCLVKG